MRCYQEFRRELEQPMDLKWMIDGMARFKGGASDHACL